MDLELLPSPNHFFTLRMWQEELGEGASEWRGQLRHVSSGQVFYFREWQALIARLREQLAEMEAPNDETWRADGK